MTTLAILKMLESIRLEIRALGYTQTGMNGLASELRWKAADEKDEAFRLEGWVQQQETEKLVVGPG